VSRLLALALVALAAALAAAAPASARQLKETAQSGLTYAELSFDRHSDLTFTDLHLTILRGGNPVFYGPVNHSCRGCQIQPAGGGEGGALRARDVDGDGEPEVIVDLYTGGAHCCLDSLLYRYQALSNTYAPLYHGWGNAGYRLHDDDRDGVPEFLSADERFLDVFGPYATYAPPVRIFHLSGGRIVDVTRTFRARLGRDARRLYADFRRAVRKRQYLYGRNLLAAYVAESYLIGRRAPAERRLRAALRRRLLRRERGDTWPAGSAYVRKLHRVLRHLGYTRR
jgi:hypothetical protein